MDRTTEGWGNGLLGVIIFSASLPATRIVGDFSPLFLTSARAVIAALLAAAFLLILRPVRPWRGDLGSLAVAAFGVVVGFPLLTALALQHITAAHSIVFIGLLPLATATFGVLRGGERPKPLFWLFSGLGGATVAGFALFNSGFGSLMGDLLMVAAVLLCGFGYAEGASLSRRLGGWQVISWALLLALPIMVAVALITMPGSWGGIGSPALVRSRLCLDLQHVGRLRLLVSRTRARRHCLRRAAAIAPALPGPDVGGPGASRGGRLDDDCGHGPCRSLCRRRQALCLKIR
jgi:drug/metabolite transporter (DMT)-like permease